MRNKTGPRMVPCGTPCLALIQFELMPLSLTLCKRSVRKSCIEAQENCQNQWRLAYLQAMVANGIKCL